MKYHIQVLWMMSLSWGIFSLAQADDQLFESKIRPVLHETCFRCHGDPQAKVAGNLRVDSREALVSGGDSGAAIVPGEPESSLILKALKRQSDVSPMPPEQERALREDQIADFERWIAQGAPWPQNTATFSARQHWAFAPLASTPPGTTIDQLINQPHGQPQRKLRKSADKRTLIRRVTFDLTGLPPTSAEVEAFVNDPAADAYERLIDRLLESPHYGEHWARHWLDVVRYADTAGETADYPVPTAWRYRNYVIEAFNSDMPYDQFLREQIAGDILALQAGTASAATTSDDTTSDDTTSDAPTSDDHTSEGKAARLSAQIVATGYLAISRRFGFDSENYHHLTIQDTIDTLGQSVLGLSLGCARCHDHKYDPISMQDYYGLYGIFDSTRYPFPGSEQKQKVRCLMPLVSPSTATRQWQSYAWRVAHSRELLAANGRAPSPAILRSLADMDGDFELQAPAAGGSNGVLVPPWIATGNVAVSNEAQSPFTQFYAAGKSGIRIAAGAEPKGYYAVQQALYPERTAERQEHLYFSVDLRVTDDGSSNAAHEILLGNVNQPTALRLVIDRTAVRLQLGSTTHQLGQITLGQWMNVQLHVDPVAQQIIASTKSQETIQSQTLAWSQQTWSINHLWLRPELAESAGTQSSPSAVDQSTERIASIWPAVEYDNFMLADQPPVPAVDDQEHAELAELSLALARRSDMETELKRLVGLDADYELQIIDTAPAAPWNAGPNSVVKVMARAQSPASDRFAPGNLGIHMPNRAAYDGFGCGLPETWTAEQVETVYASFDFRCADISAGGEGSWRFYLGHGPGKSAAVELFIGGQSLFARSADARPIVAPLVVGNWYRVDLQFNLKQRSYSGAIANLASSEQVPIPFSGQVASGWDGTIDHTFIDSYGHIGGVRPALDVDNYAVTAGPLPISEHSAIHTTQQLVERRARVSQLRQELVRTSQLLEQTAERLNQLLIDGPFPMAYAVAEGTPHDVPIQLRGEPTALGPLTPRSFVRVLGHATPEHWQGSGRLQLARWLTEQVQHLTARVMVNRIWQYHFGHGIVATPNDFGVRGAAPTHPALLDYLAEQFIQSGWSIKAVHRLILRSEVYQQTSMVEAPSDQVSQPDSWIGFIRRRLSAEEIRDSILAVSGLLDPAQAQGHPFPPAIQWGYTQHGPFSAVYEHRQRSLYLMTQRLKRHPFLALFDGADPNASTAVRPGSIVPTQALYFLNDPFVHQASQSWADRLVNQNALTSERVRAAYVAALARPPQAEELQAALDFLNQYAMELAKTEASLATDSAERVALAAWLRALIGSNEFIHID